MSTWRRTAAAPVNLGTGVLTAATKPVHKEKVRLQLPVLREKGTPLIIESQSDFLDKLSTLSRGATPTKIRLDPLKILEPSNKKLKTLEAQRIIGVIDEAKLKCDFIIILKYVIKELPKFEELLGLELTNVIREHSQYVTNLHSLEHIYQDLLLTSTTNTAVSSIASANTIGTIDLDMAQRRSIYVRNTSKRESAGTPMLLKNAKEQVEMLDTLPGYGSVRSSVVASSVQEDMLRMQTTHTLIELNKLKPELEFSIRNVLRAFRNKEEIMLLLITECSGGRTREGAYFVQCLLELKEMLLDRLMVTPIEQHDKMQFLTQIASQEKNNLNLIAKLEAELDKAVNGRDRDIKARNNTIHTLQVNLQMLEKTTEDDIRRATNEAEKQKQSDNKASQARKSRLSVELKGLKYSLINDVTDHRDEEQVLRMKKYKIECEIESWIHKFDVEMTEKQNEYEEIDERYQEEKKQLMELEQRFSLLETEYKEIIRLKEIERLEKEAERRLWQRRVHAVTIIQALWRAFKVRKIIKLKEKQKGKKKKGKKWKMKKK